MNKELLATAWSRIGNHIVLDGAVREAALALLGDVLNFPAPGTPAGPIAPPPAAGGRQRIALCLGHGRAGDEGADAIDGTSEEDFNFKIIERVAEALRQSGIDGLRVTFYQGNGYTDAMKQLAAQLMEEGATAAVEFHFNAGTGASRGHEFLHWNESSRGVTLAKSLLGAFDQAFPEHPSRGLKPKTAKDRGALFLSLTHCPAVIAEPFFGDTRAEWDLFSSEAGMDQLVAAYVAGISKWIASQP